MNAHAQSFRDLIVYQKSRIVAASIFRSSKHFPKEETFSLTDQIRRSSRSIGAQIAGAWGKRRYIRHFIAKLSDADSEQMETQHWIDVCVQCRYIKNAEGIAILQQLEEIGKMLHSMLSKAESFCNNADPYIRENQDEYFSIINSTDY